MTSTDDDHDGTAEPITDRVHGNSWSANPEEPKYADDPELAVRDALTAVDHTASGNHVDLVTHGDLGHPEGFRNDASARSATASTRSTSSGAGAAATSPAWTCPERVAHGVRRHS